MKFFLIYNTVSGLRSFRLEQPTITLGTLPSNHLVLAGDKIEPIHSIIEKQPDGGWHITDLGSEAGIFVNDKKIHVEADLQPGDKVVLGGVELHFEQQVAVPATTTNKDIAQGQVLPQSEGTKDLPKEDNLFKVDGAKKPKGKTLEVVAYWGDRVLEIEHYHKPGTGKDLPSVATIGHPPKADFLAAGPKNLKLFTIAKATSSGFTLKLAKGMKARLRRSGKVKKVETAGNYKLSSKDIADVEYGPIRYFFLYVTLPKLQLPKQSPRDPLLLALMWFGTASFLLFSTIMAFTDPPDKDPHRSDDIWSVVSVAKEVDPEIEKEKVEKKKVVIKDKPKPNVKPSIPKREIKPIPVEKPKEVKEIKKLKQVIQPKPRPKIQQIAVKPPTKKPPAPKSGPQGSVKKTGLANPDGVGAGRPIAGLKKGTAKGSPGAGNNQKGAARKGKSASSVAGVEGVSNKKASGVNLSKLGQSAGKIFNKSGAGAIQTNFRSSGGGLGGGSGSASRTRGLGGSLTQGSALGLEGSSGQMNNFGSGAGGLLSGSGGTGGFSTKGPGGRSRAPVNIHVGSGGAPGVSGGLSQGEVSGVIRSQHNAIRHCYEKILQKQPNAAGKVTMRFVIGANGSVLTTSVQQDTIRSSELNSCIIARIRTWKFPKPAGGQKVTISYPWVFKGT